MEHLSRSVDLPLIGREEELGRLSAHFVTHAQSRMCGATLFGPAGAGKTALALAFARQHANLFPGGVWVEHVPTAPESFWRRHEFAELAQQVVAPLTASLAQRRRSLVILDDRMPATEYLYTEVTRRILDKLAGAASQLGVLALKTTARNVSRHSYRFETYNQMDRSDERDHTRSGWLLMPISPVYRGDIRRALLAAAGGSTHDVRALVRHTGGDVRTAALLLHLVEGGEPPEILAERFKPIEFAACTGLDGAPMQPTVGMIQMGAESAFAVRSGLLKRMTANPELMKSLTGREFEELVAALYDDAGFDVELTPASHDGGFDIYARQSTPFGKLITLIECKRHSQQYPVGVHLVRHLFGVVEAAQAHAGVLATTSTFTRGAKSFAQQHSRVALQDYFSLQDMLPRASSSNDRC